MRVILHMSGYEKLYADGTNFISSGDYQKDSEVQKWLAEGNEPEMYQEPEPSYSKLRAAAYRAESDPLFDAARNEAIYDGTEPDYTEALAKVSEIKERFPKPEGE